MIIELNEDKIILSEFGTQLKSYQIQQLNFWGFVYNQSAITFTSNLEYKEILLKVIDYFKKEKISFILNKLCNDKLDEILKEKLEFENHIEKALDYKNGNFQKDELNEFVTFLKNHIPRKLK